MSDEWKPIDSAPKNGAPFQAKIPGHGSDNVIWWTDGLVDSDGHSCGSWCFVEDQEPPDSWTDGFCWEVNDDGQKSVEPTHWRPLPAPPPSG